MDKRFSDACKVRSGKNSDYKFVFGHENSLPNNLQTEDGYNDEVFKH